MNTFPIFLQHEDVRELNVETSVNTRLIKWRRDEGMFSPFFYFQCCQNITSLLCCFIRFICSSFFAWLSLHTADEGIKRQETEGRRHEIFKQNGTLSFPFDFFSFTFSEDDTNILHLTYFIVGSSRLLSWVYHKIVLISENNLLSWRFADNRARIRKGTMLTKGRRAFSFFSTTGNIHLSQNSQHIPTASLLAYSLTHRNATFWWLNKQQARNNSYWDEIRKPLETNFLTRKTTLKYSP